MNGSFLPLVVEDVIKANQGRPFVPMRGSDLQYVTDVPDVDRGLRLHSLQTVSFLLVGQQEKHNERRPSGHRV